jgi:hypothetical protein
MQSRCPKTETIQPTTNHLAPNIQVHTSHGVSPVGNRDTPAVSVASISEEGMISLRGDAENGGSCLMGNEHNIKYIFTYNNAKECLPLSPHMMINAKECMFCEIFFVFQLWCQKRSLGTTCVQHTVSVIKHGRAQQNVQFIWRRSFNWRNDCRVCMN